MTDTATADSGVLHQGAIVAGRYQILRVIGIGSMGTVYVCRALKGTRPLVAMKVLNPISPDGQFDQNFLARFEREVAVARMVQHPNVVQLLDVISEEHLAAHVLEYISGGDLASYIRLHTPISFREVARLLAEICAGVYAIHSAGIIHRDLKPENILLSDDRHAKISDFGLARVTGGPNLTAKGGVVGTIRYLSPEYIESGTVSLSGDICAIGLLGYEIMLGRSPYAGMTFYETIEQKVKNELEPIAVKIPSCPPELGAIIDRAVRLNAADRYPTADAMRSDLISILDRLPATIEPARNTPSVQRRRLRTGQLRSRRAYIQLLASGILLGMFLLVGSVMLKTWISERLQVAALRENAKKLSNLKTQIALNTAPHNRQGLVSLEQIEREGSASAAIEPPQSRESKGSTPPVPETELNAAVSAAPVADITAAAQSFEPAPSPVQAPMQVVRDIELPVPHSEALANIAPEPEPKRVASRVDIVKPEVPPSSRSKTSSRQGSVPSQSKPEPPVRVASVQSQPDLRSSISAASSSSAAIVPPTPVPILTSMLPGEVPPATIPVAPEFKVRATLLYRFADYIQWPVGAFAGADAPVRLCVLGTDPFGTFIDSQTALARTRSGHPFKVSRFSTTPSAAVLRRCQLVYVSEEITREARSTLKNLSAFPLLIVTEESDYGMINFLIEDRKVKFNINRRRAEQAGLTIGPVLLDLALEVTE